MPTPSAAPHLVLHRFALSGHCHRVELFLHLLGLPFDVREVDLLRGEQKGEAFLALNRFGQVPVLEVDGQAIADSNAILVYLALRHAPQWYPTEPRAAARVQRWLSAAAGQLDAGPATARFTALFKPGRDCSEAVRGAHALFALIDEELGDSAFIAADVPTIADLALYTYTAHAPEGGVALDAYPRLCAWLRRIETLPGFVPMAASGAAAGVA